MNVEITYFLRNGDFFLQTEYVSTKPDMRQIISEVGNMYYEKRLPGLTNGIGDVIILIQVGDKKHLVIGE